MMITKEQVIPVLLKACPSFQEPWDEFETKDIFYAVLGEFVDHLLALQKSASVETLKAVGEAIETLHIEGDSYVREAATIGLLEGIQNSWAHQNIDPELFRQYLQPESLRCWDELNAFWRGDRRYVGEGLTKNLTATEIAEIRKEVQTRFPRNKQSLDDHR
jgi:hypothetical protein